jgi:hypothetical protein
MSDDRVRRAKQAELEALVDEHGSEGEKFALDLSSLRRGGITLSRLHEIGEGDKTVPMPPPDPELVAATIKRISRRRELSLGRRDCIHGEPACVCLRDTLDVAPASQTKRKLLAQARRLHKRRHPTGPLARFRHLIPKPRPSEPRDPLTTPPVPVPAPVAEVTETQTRPFRRRKRWYDDDRGAGGIMGMRF